MNRYGIGMVPGLGGRSANVTRCLPISNGSSAFKQSSTSRFLPSLESHLVSKLLAPLECENAIDELVMLAEESDKSCNDW